MAENSPSMNGDNKQTHSAVDIVDLKSNNIDEVDKSSEKLETDNFSNENKEYITNTEQAEPENNQAEKKDSNISPAEFSTNAEPIDKKITCVTDPQPNLVENASKSVLDNNDLNVETNNDIASEKLNFKSVEKKDELTDLKNVCNTNETKASTTTQALSTMPVIESVSSLASSDEADPSKKQKEADLQSVATSQKSDQDKGQPQILKNIVRDTLIKPSKPNEVKNKSTMTRPFMVGKSVECSLSPCTKSVETDIQKTSAIVPLPVPCYMPIPLCMYQKPYPILVPVPLPIPVPIFIPTTRRSFKGVVKQIRKFRSKIPSNPFEAEMVRLAANFNDEATDSDDSLPDTSEIFHADEIENETKQKYAIHREGLEILKDLENDIGGSSITSTSIEQSTQAFTALSSLPSAETEDTCTSEGPTNDKKEHNGRKRMKVDADWQKRTENAKFEVSRKSTMQIKKVQDQKDKEISDSQSVNHTSKLITKSQERLDANHHLKFTYGVNAWKHWVAATNIRLEEEREQGIYKSHYENDLLKMRADELNFTLCMFVKEAKKQNGEPYAADSVLYLTYGIQEYLFENGRADSIFTDQYYEPFTSALHEVVQNFKLPTNELGYYVTRIEEEHLWEARQLGVHSPQVLLNTLLYYNTKYFMLRTAEDHQRLFFTDISKHWKSLHDEKEGQKCVTLQYCPQAKKGSKHEEKKSYEQRENNERPLRCPVKLYEFYVSKCPSNNEDKVFYLTPEHSCKPNSPIWYNNSPLSGYAIDKMLQRNLMVREVQENMLSNAC